MSFDRFAAAASGFVSRAPFFCGCVVLVLVWGPSIAVIGDVNTWQLIINTITTIVTFLLVALLQNSQARFEAATNEKLNAIAQGLADVLKHADTDETRRDCRRLLRSVGLEEPNGED